MDSSLAVLTFILALVPTGLLSFLFVWLLRDVIKPRLALALVANGISLLVLMAAIGFALIVDGRPNFGTAFLAFFIPQGIWTLFAALPRAERSVSR
jgi:hypothetical protein